MAGCHFKRRNMEYIIIFGERILESLVIGPMKADEIPSVLDYLGPDENATILPLRPVKEVVK